MKKAIRISLMGVVLILAVLYFYGWYTPTPHFPSLHGEYSTHHLEHQGRERHYALYKPNALASGAPLVFVLHGSRGSGDVVRDMTAREFDALADQHQFMVAYPDGFAGHWNDCRRSADYAANVENVDDIGFFISLIDTLSQSHGIDRERVSVTGFSNGGHMVYRLALESPDLFAAYAAMAANLPEASNRDCLDQNRPVSLAIMNGTEDPINPHAGGLVSLFGNDSRGVVLSSEHTAQFWRDRAKLNPQPAATTHPEVDGNPHTQVEQKTWTDGQIRVSLYTLIGSGHVIASQRRRFPRLLGGDAGDISGPQQIVSFLLQH